MISRRQLLKRSVSAGTALAALAVAGKAALDVAPAGAANYFATGAALNLRTGPGTNYGVILVVPQGGVVTDLGTFQNNYRKVSYKGSTGWVSMDYLIVSDGGGNVPGDFVGGSKTISAANLRSGPGTNNSVLRVVPAGAVVQTSLQTRNGFRYVSHNGLAGWIFDELLVAQPDGESPNSLTTTAWLNLRAEPSLSARILKVLAPGTLVSNLGQGSNGFVKISSGQTVGWASAAYLN
ncbi:MAG: SH3 domain-containing protein [Thermomicrobiales bacterium]